MSKVEQGGQWKKQAVILSPAEPGIGREVEIPGPIDELGLTGSIHGLMDWLVAQDLCWHE